MPAVPRVRRRRGQQAPDPAQTGTYLGSLTRTRNAGRLGQLVKLGVHAAQRLVTVLVGALHRRRADRKRVAHRPDAAEPEAPATGPLQGLDVDLRGEHPVHATRVPTANASREYRNGHACSRQRWGWTTFWQTTPQRLHQPRRSEGPSATAVGSCPRARVYTPASSPSWAALSTSNGVRAHTSASEWSPSPAGSTRRGRCGAQAMQADHILQHPIAGEQGRRRFDADPSQRLPVVSRVRFAEAELRREDLGVDPLSTNSADPRASGGAGRTRSRRSQSQARQRAARPAVRASVGAAPARRPRHGAPPPAQPPAAGRRAGRRRRQQSRISSG